MVDTFLVVFAYHLAYFLRFDGIIPPAFFNKFLQTVIWIAPLKLFCFYLFNLYRGMWRYTSIHDLINLTKACIVSSALIAAILAITIRFTGFARSVFVIDFLLTFLMVGSCRVGIRLYFQRRSGKNGFTFLRRFDQNARKLLIIGAGDAGEKMVREINDNPNLNYHIVGFVDDDVSKLRKAIHGISILGTLNDLEDIAKSWAVEEIIIAVSSASAVRMRRIVNFCENTGVSYKTLPALGELIEGKVSVSALREVRYEDLLGRKPVNLDTAQIGEYLTGKRIMVTGGAGSIGSELCRQIIRFKPSLIIIVDHNESALYEIDLNISAQHPEIKTIPILVSVQNKALMEKVFRAYEPQVIFHAAAYKHVPMLEFHPWEAVFNNIVGTKILLGLCSGNGVERFVMVSTDKAVRPTNVMGASKRVDELLTQAFAQEHGSRFMSVRFGNVVGSIGSVVPLFRHQIELGGPVTVTDPEVTRYFMTIPEASSLILQAGSMGNGGEIFVLKMGAPIRIEDMARDIISLSGYKPDEEIEIKYTGLRPGEKLYEELITEDEDIMKTAHEDIMVLNSNLTMSLEQLDNHIRTLMVIAQKGDAMGIKEELKRIVPDYEPQF